MESTKACESLIDANQYCNECPSARCFLDAHMSTLVTVLLDKMNLCDIEAAEKAVFTMCLRRSLETVTEDLAEAAKSGRKCTTLPVIAEIFDEATGYDDPDRMRSKFVKMNGFQHLAAYLKTCKKTDFPSMDTIMTILELTESVLPSSMHTEDAIAIAHAAMTHLSCLEEEGLIRLDDDCIDICNAAEKIYKCVDQPQAYFTVYRKFILNPVTSASVSLKLLGWSNLRRFIHKSARQRPHPKAYLVSGSGMEDVNGVYKVNSTQMTDGRRLNQEYLSGLEYIKTSPGGMMVLTPDNTDWKIYQQCDDETLRILYQTRELNGFRLSIPRENEWSPIAGDAPSPTVWPLGFVISSDRDYNTLGHELVHWFLQRGLIELAACDMRSTDSDVQREAKKAMKSMLNSVNQLLNMICESIPKQSELGDNIINDTVFEARHAIDVSSFFMKYLLLGLQRDSLAYLKDDFLLQLSRQLKDIIIRSEIFYPQCIGDFFVFHGLLILRLLNCRSRSKIELGRTHLWNMDHSLRHCKDIILSFDGTLGFGGIYDLLIPAETAAGLFKHCYSKSWLDKENETRSANIKRAVWICLSSLHIDTEQWSDLQTVFARGTYNILAQMQKDACNNSPREIAEYHSFLRAVAMKQITSSNASLQLDGCQLLCSLLREARSPELAKWIIQNRIIEMTYKNGVPGDAVAKCTMELIEFVKDMCTDDELNNVANCISANRKRKRSD